MDKVDTPDVEGPPEVGVEDEDDENDQEDEPCWIVWFVYHMI